MLQSEINVTPLVDVCLVLLIIFMVVTPMVVAGSAVQLPETRNDEKLGAAPLAVTVMADETVLIGSQVVRGDQVVATLQQQRAGAHAESVAVRGDKRVRYGAVVEVLDACRTAGWTDVRLVSLKKTD